MKKSIKPFVIGTLVGSLLTVSSVAFADDGIQAIKALLNNNTKITVNGKASSLTNPTLSYEGKTYVYIKDIGKLVGATVNWNAKKKTVEITTNGSTVTGQTASSKIIATYQGGTVTDKEFNKYAMFFSIVNPQTSAYMGDPQMKEQFLREYIGYKLLYAKVAGKPMSKEEEAKMNEFLGQVKTYLSKAPQIKAAADKEGLTEDDFKHFYMVVTGVMNDIESKVTDALIQAEFEKTKADYNVVSVRHILVSTTDPQTGKQLRTDEEALTRAQKVKGLLDAGGDWNVLAKEYSDDPGSKDNGGLYEDQQSKLWVTEFKDAANTQPVGKIGDPVKSDFGYHVMKVEKRVSKTFDQLSAGDQLQIKQTIASRLLNDFMTNELPGKITKIDLT
jgi:foldase protein PrsA